MKAFKYLNKCWFDWTWLLVAALFGFVIGTLI